MSDNKPNHAPVAPVPDRKYIKGTPEYKAHKATKKPINGHPTNLNKEETEDQQADRAMQLKRFKDQMTKLNDPNKETADKTNKLEKEAMMTSTNLNKNNNTRNGLSKENKDNLADINEALNPSMGVNAYINDYIKSTNPRFNNMSKAERRRAAIAAYMAAKRRQFGEEVELDETNAEYKKKPDTKPGTDLIDPRKTVKAFTKGSKYFGTGKVKEEVETIEESHYVMAHSRSRGSSFPVKDINGNIQKHDTEEAANARAKELNDRSSSPHVYYTYGGKMHEGKNWIAGAIKHPGALTRAAKRAGETNAEYEQEHKHDSGKAGRRARLALTLKKLNKEEFEQIDEVSKKQKIVSKTSLIKMHPNGVGMETEEGWANPKIKEETMKSYKQFISQLDEVTFIKKDENEIEINEGVVTGTRKVKDGTFEHGTHKAEVRYSPEWQEYQVHHYKNGKHRGEGPVSYHGSDKEDAMDTAKYHISKLKTMSEEFEQIELDEAVQNKKFAMQGKMHSDLASRMTKGKLTDYNEPSTGKPAYGKVIHNDGKQVHIQSQNHSYDPKKGSTVHKFNVSSHLGEEFEQIDEYNSDASGVYRNTKKATYGTSYDDPEGKEGSSKEKTAGRTAGKIVGTYKRRQSKSK